MAKLLIFAACERAIISQDDSSASLISLLEKIRATLPFPLDQPVPEKAAVPVRWCAFSVWHFEEDDSGVELTQMVTRYSPSGKSLISADFKLERFGEHKGVRASTQFSAFPLPEFGIFSLRLFFRRSHSDWREVAEYPIEVVQATTPENSAQHSTECDEAK
jgi:hypothetical protein